MTSAVPDLVDVEVRQVPVDLWSRAQEHSDALMREFALIASDTRDDGGHLPARLVSLMAQLNAGYAEFTGEQEALLGQAADEGRAEIDLHYRVPRGVGAAALELGRLLDEADEYCRQGQHLLTLAAPEEFVRFRWWFLDQFADQEAGRPPVAWPDYRR